MKTRIREKRRYRIGTVQEHVVSGVSPAARRRRRPWVILAAPLLAGLLVLGWWLGASTPLVEVPKAVIHLKPLLREVTSGGLGGPALVSMREWIATLSAELPEGFSSPSRHFIDPETKVLVLEPRSDSEYPEFTMVVDIDAAEAGLLLLKMDLSAASGGRDTGRVYWRAENERFSTARFCVFDIWNHQKEQGFFVYTIPLEDEPGWEGRIREIKVVPVLESCPVRIEMASLARARIEARRALEGKGAPERLQLGGVSHEAILVTPPSLHRAELAVPPAGELRVALGLRLGPVEKGAAVGFRVTVLDGSDRAVVIDEALPSGGASWTYARADLSRYAGKTVVLEFAVTAPPGGGRSLIEAAWGAPVVVPAARAAAGSLPGREPPSFVVVCLDTCRADHLSAYGYHRPTSPNLERLASEGFLFERAYCQAPFTLGSHASLFTSLYLEQTGVTTQDGLPGTALTMAEIFRAHGYLTAAFTDGGYLRDVFGMAQGFDHYDERAGGAAPVFERSLCWLEGERHVPFLAFVHTYQTHSPYNAPEEFRQLVTPRWRDLPEQVSSQELRSFVEGEASIDEDEWEKIVALYDAGVAYTDHELGRFLDRLETMGLSRDTVVVVLSDHGEELGEHGGALHGKTLYEELIQVPLIVRVPEGVARQGELRPRRIGDVVGLVDVLPTLLDLAGIEKPRHLEGRSLVRLLKGHGSEKPAEFVSLSMKGLEGNALVTSRWKYARVDPMDTRERKLRMQGEYVFDLKKDRGERRNLAGVAGAQVRELRVALEDEIERWMSAGGRLRVGVDLEDVGGAVTPEVMEELRRLGYVE